ncbi:MAG: helix-turn-helix domain-containing protein [Polyangiaceae bacterium]
MMRSKLGLTSQAKLLRALEEAAVRGWGRAVHRCGRGFWRRRIAIWRRWWRRAFEICVQDLGGDVADPVAAGAGEIFGCWRSTCCGICRRRWRSVRRFSAGAMEVICAYSWPGNVRELRNAVEHALVLGDGAVIEPSDLPEIVRQVRPKEAPAGEGVVRLPMRLAELEALDIAAAMEVTGGNRTRAAALLGINRVTLYKKLKEEPPGQG